MEKTEAKLKELLAELNKISLDKGKFDRIAERTKAIAIKQFDSNQTHSREIEKIYQRIHNALMGFHPIHINAFKGVLEVMIDEAELNQLKTPTPSNQQVAPIKNNSVKSHNNKVFIVHGHNDTMKEATARMLAKLHLEPIILHEQANAGSTTIIDKFTKHSDVGFAVVLLSADDFGYAKAGSEIDKKLRARQNVILELGFFYCKLGRERVVAIFEHVNNFEKPSDIDGVIYIPYNSGDTKWQFDLVKELKSAGYDIDTNILV